MDVLKAFEKAVIWEDFQVKLLVMAVNNLYQRLLEKWKKKYGIFSYNSRNTPIYSLCIHELLPQVSHTNFYPSNRKRPGTALY